MIDYYHLLKDVLSLYGGKAYYNRPCLRKIIEKHLQNAGLIYYKQTLDNKYTYPMFTSKMIAELDEMIITDETPRFNFDWTGKIYFPDDDVFYIEHVVPQINEILLKKINREKNELYDEYLERKEIYEKNLKEFKTKFKKGKDIV